MKTVILSSGSISDYKTCMELIKTAQYIICADGGTRHTYKMGVLPDIIIGDLDSSNNEYIAYYRKKGVPIKEYQTDKDKTDTQICLEYALSFSSEIVMLGATGSRIDHTLANISLLKLGLDHKIPVSIIDSNNLIMLTADTLTQTGKKGELFSLIPLSEKVEGVTTFGAHYELSNADMVIGDSYGISNYFASDSLQISIKKGYLLFIKSVD